MQYIKFLIKMPSRVEITLDRDNFKSFNGIRFSEKISEQLTELGFVKHRDFYINDEFYNQVILSISEHKMDYELTQVHLDKLGHFLDENFKYYQITVYN